MKRSFTNIVLLLVLFSQRLTADTVGHGGDPLAAEFVARGQAVYEKVKSRLDLLTSDQLKRFQEGLLNTRIELTEAPVVDREGGVVTSMVLPDPIYPGKKYVLLNRVIWKKILDEKFGIDKFVFHEYLRVIEVEDSHYEVSSKLDQEPQNSIYVKTYLKGDLVPASKPYASVIKFPNDAAGVQYAICRSTLNYQDELPAKTQAMESALTTELTWLREQRQKILAEWKVKFPIQSIEFENASFEGKGITETDDDIQRRFFPQERKIATGPYSQKLVYWQHFFKVTDTDYNDNRNESRDRGETIKMGPRFPTNYNYNGFCPAEIAFQAKTQVEIRIRFNPDAKIQASEYPAIKGSQMAFFTSPNSTPAEIVNAINNAEKSFNDACIAWKNQITERFGEYLIFADCGIPSQIRSPLMNDGSHLNSNSVVERKIHFQSQPIVYYYRDSL